MDAKVAKIISNIHATHNPGVIIQLAEELQLLEATRIAEIEIDGPRVSFNQYGEMEIELLRNSKVLTLNFSEHSVQICKAKREELQSWELLRLDMSVEADDFYYFIKAIPEDVGLPRLTSVTKGEAVILVRKKKQSEREQYGF